mgnify:CR=1 FL=1
MEKRVHRGRVATNRRAHPEMSNLGHDLFAVQALRRDRGIEIKRRVHEQRTNTLGVHDMLPAVLLFL